jgi:Ran GTPase-activating protein (RanGAP) involved in mRNA processing and transport
MEVLVQDRRLANVKRLNLGGNKVGDFGASLIAESPSFGKLVWLELGGNDIGPVGLERLIKSPNLKKLKTLNLYRNYIKDQGARILAEENLLTAIEELDLALNEIGDAGLLALANSKNFPNLASACLDNNFTSQNARESAKLGINFKKLQSLNL